MILNQEPENLIDGFIRTQAVNRGLDERTAKAYRLDIELFFRWLESEEAEGSWEKKIEDYLEYLAQEKRLRFSTINRKKQVFLYYLSYLKTQNIIKEIRPLKALKQPEKEYIDTLLTKSEVDAFFYAIKHEYTELDSEFRRRICLRDQVMMKLLFYHRIEISELLKLEISDYNRKTAILRIRRKRERDRIVYLFSRTLQEQMEQWLLEHEYFEHVRLYYNCLFLSKLGEPLSMKMVINIFNKYRTLAGIEKECTPKDLKNSLDRYAKELMMEQC